MFKFNYAIHFFNFPRIGKLENIDTPFYSLVIDKILTGRVGGLLQ